MEAVINLESFNNVNDEEEHKSLNKAWSGRPWMDVNLIFIIIKFDFALEWKCSGSVEERKIYEPIRMIGGNEQV
jgi:hypothetical protein